MILAGVMLKSPGSCALWPMQPLLSRFPRHRDAVIFTLMGALMTSAAWDLQQGREGATMLSLGNGRKDPFAFCLHITSCRAHIVAYRYFAAPLLVAWCRDHMF